ncbi:hypothetical protein JCM10908_005035 [Rhodotorula pacifica]|uniref:uncharacterized protein n=1 Tax=Rhodotorula pacifica TaxID=1495444 RepID=UPI003172A717
MDSEVAQVIQAIQALYDPSTPPSVQSTLQRQLQLVQSSPSAWSVVGTLISHSDPSVRFFGAATLQQAITRSWHSLDPNNPAPIFLEGPVASLKESLLHWLSTSAAAAYPANGAPGTSGEKPVLRKLAAATTSLSLRLGAEWNDWLLEVVMRIAASGAAREASLEVLSTAIEEIARADFVGSQRMSYMSSLSSTIPHLVSTLTSSISPTAKPSEINLALSCFVAYLNAGQLSHTELTTLYPCLLPHVSRSETVIAAASALEELIERSSGLSDTGGSGVTRFMNRQRTTELVQGWAIGPYVRQVTEQAIAEAREGSDPDDEALAVFKLVSTLADHLITTFLFDPPPPSAAQVDPSSTLTLAHPSVHALLSLLLALSTFPGYSSEAYTINELPTSPWMNLQELGADEGFIPGEGEGREGRPGREAEWAAYRDVFSALADGLRARATRPREEEFLSWPQDVRDAFRMQRSTTVADTIQYAYFVLRDDLIAKLVQLAAEQVAIPSPGGKDSYEDLEATLFMLHSLGEVVPMASTLSEMEPTAAPSPLQQYLATLFGPAVLGRMPSEPGMHPSLRSTALRLVGAYSSWFASQPDACLQAVTFVISGLQEPDLVPGAAKALRGLCDANRKVLMQHVPSFVQVLGGLEGRIPDTELAKVLQSVASVVQALPENEIVEPLLTLASPIVDKLATACRNASQNPDLAREDCLQQLSYLAALSRGLADPEGDVIDLDASLDETSFVRESAQRVLSDARVDDMRRRLAQGIEGVAQTWPGDAEIVTALSEYIRQSTSDAIPSPLALDSLALLTLCANALKLAASSVWLGVAAQLLARMSRDLSDGAISDAELGALTTPVGGVLTVILSAYPNTETMGENPDVVAAFLAFCSQITRLYPRIFSTLPPNYLEAVLAFAERGLAMQEQFSLKTTIELLLASVQQTRMASPSATTYQSIILPRIPSIMRSTLSAIGGGAPRSHLVSLSELLHACLLRVPDQARPALKALLAEPGFPTERATDDAKARFERAVTSARTGKQVRQAVADFALVCRGLDGSAYGAATTAY